MWTLHYRIALELRMVEDNLRVVDTCLEPVLHESLHHLPSSTARHCLSRHEVQFDEGCPNYLRRQHLEVWTHLPPLGHVACNGVWCHGSLHIAMAGLYGAACPHGTKGPCKPMKVPQLKACLFPGVPGEHLQCAPGIVYSILQVVPSPRHASLAWFAFVSIWDDVSMPCNAIKKLLGNSQMHPTQSKSG